MQSKFTKTPSITASGTKNEDFRKLSRFVIRSYQKRWRNTETGDCPPKFITRKAFVKKTEVYVCRTRRTNARIIRNNADRTSEASRKEYRSSLQTRLFVFLIIVAMPELTSTRLFRKNTNITKADRIGTAERSVDNGGAGKPPSALQRGRD